MLKKITSIICCCIISICSIALNAQQKIDLDLKNISLEQLIKTIESKTTYSFMFDSTLHLSQKVSVSNKDAKVESILNEVFKNKGISYEILGNQIVLKSSIQQTTTGKPKSSPKKISGTILDKEGEPLIGVSVVVKGTTQGAMTDLDGKFTINASAQDVVVYSYMGYITQEVKVGDKTNFDLVLEENAVMLDDIVVTALGIKRESKALTYNVQEVKASDITAVKDANFVNSLAGKIAGVQINSSASGIGGSTRVVMRGTKSMFGNNNALYVIDGVPLYDTRPDQPEGIFESPDGGDGDSFSNLNPDDIESISVLSGPAAAALYGNAGANGVLLITTKKGEVGKLRVNYSNSTTFMNPFVMPKFQNKYGSEENSFFSWGDKLATPTSYKPKDFFQTGYNETNSLNISFGTERSQTYFSVAALNARGIIPNNKFNRYNATIRNSSELIKDKLNLDLSASFINQDDRNMMTQGQYHNPLLPVYLFPRGDDMEKYKIYERYDESRNFKTQFWPTGYDLSLGVENPYWTVNRKLFENNRQRYIFSGSLKYNILSWMNVMGRVRMDNTENTFTRKIYASSNKMFASDAGNYMNQKTSDKQIYADALLNIDKRFNDFSLTSNIGVSIFDYKQDLTSYEGHLLYVPNLFTMNNINPDHPETKAIQKGYHDQTQAVFATAQLGYKSLVFLDLTARNDWTSQLAFTKRNNIFYPSVGLSGVMSDIFDVSKAAVSFWKVRGSYSEVGNPPPRFITTAQFQINNGNPSNSSYLPATGLKPERTTSFEVGTNLRFWKDRINMDVTYYNSNTYNQLFQFDAPPSSGFVTYFINAGKVNNWGIEASLGFKEKFGPVNWNTNLNFTLNRNKIKELVPEGTLDPTTGKPIHTDAIIISPSGTYRMELREGGTLGDIYVSTLKYDNNGYIKVDPEMGTIEADPENWVKAGSAAPRYNWGWNNSFSFQNFDFSFLIDARIGGVGVSATQALLDRYGVSKASSDARDAGGVPINGGKISAENYYSVTGSGTTGILSQYVYSMTNVRLREASIGYTFPGKWFNNKIDALAVSLVGRNLLMFYNHAPFDPEITASTGTYYQGLDYFMQPSLRSFGFSVKLQF